LTLATSATMAQRTSSSAVASVRTADVVHNRPSPGPHPRLHPSAVTTPPGRIRCEKHRSTDTRLVCDVCPCRKPIDVSALTLSETVVIPYSREVHLRRIVSLSPSPASGAITAKQTVCRVDVAAAPVSTAALPTPV
jgi:hypothetical protein